MSYLQALSLWCNSHSRAQPKPALKQFAVSWRRNRRTMASPLLIVIWSWCGGHEKKNWSWFYPLFSVILRGERIENYTGVTKPLWCKNCIGVVLSRLWFPKKSAPFLFGAGNHAEKPQKIRLTPGLKRPSDWSLSRSCRLYRVGICALPIFYEGYCTAAIILTSLYAPTRAKNYNFIILCNSTYRTKDISVTKPKKALYSVIYIIWRSHNSNSS